MVEDNNMPIIPEVDKGWRESTELEAMARGLFDSDKVHFSASLTVDSIVQMKAAVERRGEEANFFKTAFDEGKKAIALSINTGGHWVSVLITKDELGNAQIDYHDSLAADANIRGGKDEDEEKGKFVQALEFLVQNAVDPDKTVTFTDKTYNIEPRQQHDDQQYVQNSDGKIIEIREGVYSCGDHSIANLYQGLREASLEKTDKAQHAALHTRLSSPEIHQEIASFRAAANQEGFSIPGDDPRREAERKTLLDIREDTRQMFEEQNSREEEKQEEPKKQSGIVASIVGAIVNKVKTSTKKKTNEPEKKKKFIPQPPDAPPIKEDEETKVLTQEELAEQMAKEALGDKEVEYKGAEGADTPITKDSVSSHLSSLEAADMVAIIGALDESGETLAEQIKSQADVFAKQHNSNGDSDERRSFLGEEKERMRKRDTKERKI